MDIIALEAGFIRQSLGYGLQSLLQDCNIKISGKTITINCPPHVDPDDIVARHADFNDEQCLKDFKTLKINGDGRRLTLPLIRSRETD